MAVEGKAMGADHWLDTLSKRLTQSAPRRGVVSAAAALVFAGGIGAIDSAGKNGRGGGKDKKKPKKPKKAKKPPAPCSGGACNREFVLEDNREYCEFICRQCDGDDDPRHFCIVDADPRDPNNPIKIAVCCAEGEVCCDDYCCPEGRACCDGNQCCREGHTCCDGSCCGTDNPFTACCDGDCVNTEVHQEHCGVCGNPCGIGEICRLGHCECITDCEGDDCANCPRGQSCYDGINCSCGDGFKYCPRGERCIRAEEEYVCCGNRDSGIGYCFANTYCCGSGLYVYCSATPCP